MYKFKGAYDAAAVYAVNDVVTFNDLAYRMVVATGAAGVTPCDDTNNWVPLSQDLTQVCFMMAPDFTPDVTTPQDGDVLVYDGTAGKWKNAAPSGGGMTVDYEYNSDTATHTFKAKAGDIYNALDSGASVIIRLALDEVPEGATGYALGNFVSYTHVPSGKYAGYYFDAQINGETIEHVKAATANDFPVKIDNSQN